MKKTNMLKKNYEFRNVLSKGTYYSGKYIEIFLKKNNQKINYIGIAISVKIAKATKRNKIKRYIREAYMNLETNINYGYNIVFLWKKKVDIKNASYANIKKDMSYIFYKANIIGDNK